MISAHARLFGPAESVEAGILSGPLALDEAPGRVLIVEDEPELAEILRVNLNHQGFVTEIAYDGLSACRKVGAERPDLILLDILLPDLDGWEICKMVRSHPEAEVARTPIIMLTAMGSTEDRVRGIELGADAYITKPYAVREVMSKARQLVEKHRLQLRLDRELAELREREEQRDAWQQILIHELRNQLLVISGYSRVLSDGRDRLGEDKSVEYAEAIHRSSHFLSNLAEEFVLVRQIEHGGEVLPCQPFDPALLLQDVVRLLARHADAHEVQLEVDLGPVQEFVLNDTAFKLVLCNLLENAMKYGRGGKVGVQLEPADRGFQVRVEDRGPGIPPQDLERIFAKFYRSPSVRQRISGSGLGLFTARTLAQAMGGSISAWNRPEGGARFILSFPGEPGIRNSSCD